MKTTAYSGKETGSEQPDDRIIGEDANQHHPSDEDKSAATSTSIDTLPAKTTATHRTASAVPGAFDSPGWSFANLDE